MATNLRIVVLDPGPLDGVTPLPANARARVSAHPQLGIPTLTLNAGERLGVFDPGELIFGRSGSYVLRHIAVVSSNGTPHADRTYLGIRSPSRPGGGATTRALRLLGVGEEPEFQGSGVIPEGSAVPIPVGHFVVVDTTADGGAPGPHIVQLSFDAAEAPPFEISGSGQTRNVCSPPGLRTIVPDTIVFGSLPDPRPLTVIGSGFLGSDVASAYRIVNGQRAFLPGVSLAFNTPTQVTVSIPTAVDAGTFTLRVARGAQGSCFNELVDAFSITRAP